MCHAHDHRSFFSRQRGGPEQHGPAYQGHEHPHFGHRHFGRWGAGGDMRGEHPFGRGFGPGGRERMFDGGELQLVLLAQLAEKPSYGYELIKSLEQRLAGAYSPSPGVVYPTLTLLEERGFAVASSEGGKKVFTITDEGHAELTQQAERLAEINARLEQSGERFGRGRTPELTRALGNLRGAMKARMVRGRLTREQIAKIAAAINAAADAIDKA